MWLRAQKMQTILSSMVNIIGQGVFKFDNAQDIYISSEMYERNGYGHFLCISSLEEVSVEGKSIQIRRIYIIHHH